VKTEESICV